MFNKKEEKKNNVITKSYLRDKIEEIFSSFSSRESARDYFRTRFENAFDQKTILEKKEFPKCVDKSREDINNYILGYVSIENILYSKSDNVLNAKSPFDVSEGYAPSELEAVYSIKEDIRNILTYILKGGKKPTFNKNLTALYFDEIKNILVTKIIAIVNAEPKVKSDKKAIY